MVLPALPHRLAARSSSSVRLMCQRLRPQVTTDSYRCQLPSRTLLAPTTSQWTKRFSSSSTKSKRPFCILGVQQIAIGSEKRDPLHTLWKDVFGLEASSFHRIERENVEEEIIQLGLDPYHVELDLMTPIDAEASPKVHKPPLNHIGLWVDALPAAVDWMEQQGVRFTPGGIRQGAAGYDVAFVHPKGSQEKPISGHGVLIELVQAPEKVRRALTRKNNNNNHDEVEGIGEKVC